MWDADKQARFDALRAVARQDPLTDAERTELEALLQELDALEAASLHPATERMHHEREALDAQNRQLEELLREQQAYLAEVREVMVALEARERRLRNRFAEITGREWVRAKTEASG